MKERFRLDSVQPCLAKAFRRASDVHRRAATRLACERTALVAGLSGSEVEAAIKALSSGQAMRPDLRADLETSADRLDEEYFLLDREGTEADKADALRAFSKARATAALAFALSPDPGELHEAIYEAISATDDPRDIVQAVKAALLNDRS